MVVNCSGKDINVYSALRFTKDIWMFSLSHKILWGSYSPHLQVSKVKFRDTKWPGHNHKVYTKTSYKSDKGLLVAV